MTIPPRPAGPAPLDPREWTPPRYLRRHASRVARRNRIRRLVFLGIASLLLFGFVLADGGLLSIAWRTVQLHRLEEQVTQLETGITALQREIQLRRDDPATIERLAREEYGMIYPGETLVRIMRVSEVEARRVEAARAASAQPTGTQVQTTTSP